jgi:tRNA-Thr(GGU) m(6)t(6)A37 methyltransferase TsaA
MKRSKPEQDHTSGHLEEYFQPVTFQPIGRVRSPYTERFGTPRQPVVTDQVKSDGAMEGRIELLPGKEFEKALDGLEGFDRIWVLYHLHLNDGFSPQVRPPRGPGKKIGIFATRAPHRPAPVGLSCLRLLRIEGRTLHVRGLDILDGSPVLDIKPYVPDIDSFPGARAGWLSDLDPREPDRFVPR